MFSDDGFCRTTVPFSLGPHRHSAPFSAQAGIDPIQSQECCADGGAPRKSDVAASAAEDLQTGLRGNSAQPQAVVAVSSPSVAQIAKASDRLSKYLQQQRDHYAPLASPLSDHHRAQLWPYFSGELLAAIRFVELRGTRVTLPEFFARARAKGFKPPEVSHMESLAFIDIVVFNEELSDRSLFHALVRAAQIRILGLKPYAELWMRSFLRTKAHFAVPLEVHAFSLASKFLEEKFCVEDHVLRWMIEGRY